MVKRGIIKSLKDLGNGESWFKKEVEEACFSSAPTQIIKNLDNEDTVVDVFNQKTVKTTLPSQIAQIMKKRKP